MVDVKRTINGFGMCNAMAFTLLSRVQVSLLQPVSKHQHNCSRRVGLISPRVRCLGTSCIAPVDQLVTTGALFDVLVPRIVIDYPTFPI